MRTRLSLIALCTGLLGGCGGSSSPTTPTAPQVALGLQSLRVTPSGTGVQFNTDYAFEAAGTFPAGTQFAWQFGDGGTATTTTPSATRTYSQTGVFTVTVEARASERTAAATSQVLVRSLVGRWSGTVSGHTGYPRSRQIPIVGFELIVNSATRDGAGLILSGSWADDAGCRETRNGFIRQALSPRPTAAVTMSIESLLCNDGDFILAGTADATFDRVDGTCPNGGANCRFSMSRR